MKIEGLTLYTNNLKGQRKFYEQVLGLQLVASTENLACFKIGLSMLTLSHRPHATPYHFAINMPSNKEKEALNWLKERVDILKDGDIEIQDFDFWNAMAIYFYDEDQNIVEFIARKNLDNASNVKFSSDSLLEISEIGIPTLNIEKEFSKLHDWTGIEIFDGGFERFCAIGDEHGLFIAINKAVKDWFPTNDKAYSSDFEIDCIQGSKRFKLAYKSEKLELLS